MAVIKTFYDVKQQRGVSGRQHLINVLNGGSRQRRISVYHSYRYLVSSHDEVRVACPELIAAVDCLHWHGEQRL